MTASPELAPGLTVRRAVDGDRPAVLALLADSLGWARDDSFADFFDWKHRQNPFGPSPAWVAVADDEIVGFRTFLRWEFEHPDRRRRRAVRAVDTATAPAYQGRGVFRALTTTAVAELTDDGVDFVFNTPNDQSRPGYLRMGWFDVGRLPLEARTTRIAGLWRMRTARVPAERWPVETAAGSDAAALLADDAVATLLETLPPRADSAPRALPRTCAGGTALPRSATGRSRTKTTRCAGSRCSGCAVGAAPSRRVCRSCSFPTARPTRSGSCAPSNARPAPTT